MSINLKGKPFYLQEEDIAWVRETIAAMTLEEKIGQLFIHMSTNRDESYIQSIAQKYHVGGIRFFGANQKDIYEQNRLYQKYSKTPLFVACNLETGANSVSGQATQVATHAQCGACKTDKAAYELGRISALEASVLGCNWNFGPITDIVFNWRNTIVNAKSFGNNAELVLQRSRAYIKGIHESNMLACSKHFPGDGVDERDQHLVMTVNDLSCEEWDASFGKVYKELVEDGLETMMVGHIALPSYSKKFIPDIKPEEIKPASLSKELVTNLLREQLGFNGLVITDASHMGGMLSAMPRSEQVPGAIAAGCDMFLFVHDIEEDMGYMIDGYKNGIISDERLQEALERILGMKAKLKLHKKDYAAQPIAEEVNFDKIGCDEHQQIAEEIAQETITLVKDTAGLLPIDVTKKKRARLYYIENAPAIYAKGTDPAKWIVKEELEAAGFEVDMNESLYDLECKNSSPMNMFKIMESPAYKLFKENYDVIFVFVHMSGYAQENNVRVKYAASHSNELPWWIRDIPTVCVSLNFTNHLYDLTMMRTFINAYAPTRACIKTTIGKIVGESEFEGIANENVWCESWDTRL